MARSRTYSRRTWMFKAVMGWNSFQDLWDLGIRRRGSPPASAALLVERANKRLLIWEVSRDQPLLGCGSFDFIMPEGHSFLPEDMKFGRPLPAEGEEDNPVRGGNDLGPARLRWVQLDTLDDAIRDRNIIDMKITIPAWPVFKDDSPAFADAMLEQIHREYWYTLGKRREFVWESGNDRASVHQMPLYEGGHWQVYVESWDFYRWLSDPKDPGQAPQKFPTREAATATALALRT